jgi:hypothetical protein
MRTLIHTLAGLVRCFEIHLKQILSIRLLNANALVLNLNHDLNILIIARNGVFIHNNNDFLTSRAELNRVLN